MNYSDKDVPPVLFSVTPWGLQAPGPLTQLQVLYLLYLTKHYFKNFTA